MLGVPSVPLARMFPGKGNLFVTVSSLKYENMYTTSPTAPLCMISSLALDITSLNPILLSKTNFQFSFIINGNENINF